MELSRELYAVVQTKENEAPCVTAVPKRWIIDNVLYWPKTMKIDRQNPKDPQIGIWSEHSFVMLKDNLSNLYNQV